MDLAICKTIAIPEEKMVPKALVTTAEVPAVDGLSRSKGFAQMVNHDSLPPITIKRLLKFEQRVISRTFLQIAEIGQRETGCFARGTQIQKQNDRGHGGKEASQNDLGPP